MTKEQEVLKDLKKVTLEELDEAIKAVDKQEQEEAIEYFKKHIKYFEEQIKFIEATDCDYYDEELELYQNRIKQFNTILSMLEEKDKEIQFQNDINKTELDRHKKTEKSLKGQIIKQNKMIDLMTEFIEDELTVDEFCTKEGCYADNYIDGHCEKCLNCIKQYFENKAKELLNK